MSSIEFEVDLALFVDVREVVDFFIAFFAWLMECLDDQIVHCVII